MSTIKTRDGTEIFYKDWGSGQPIVFSHGWPLSGEAWDAQMMFFGERGYRVIAHDRRGHGRSTQTWTGNDMDTYADDLAALMDHLDLNDAILVGHREIDGRFKRTEDLVYAGIPLPYWRRGNVVRIAPQVIGDHYTPNYYAYTLAFTNQEYNYSAAISFVLGAVVVVFSYTFMLLTNRGELRSR